MKIFSISFKKIAVGVVVLFVMLSTTVSSYAANQAGIIPYEWQIPLGGNFCDDAKTFTSCHFSSPVLADINDDGFLDVIVATNSGYVVAINRFGQILWKIDIAPIFGMVPGTHEIYSSPAVADLDGDGDMEIALGTGTNDPRECTQGGILLLDHTGKVVPGWPVFGHDDITPPVNCTDTYASTPALGDLDRDGTLEIIIGGYDKRLLALHYDGTLMEGFPVDSYHLKELTDWDDLENKLGDTIHSSPALADIDGDGYLDIIIGTDEGNVDYDFHAPWTWTCGYELPAGWAVNYCGGSLYVINRFGELLPGFPKYIHEIISSSPAVFDLNQDGSLEIISGTGSYYHDFSPDRPEDGYRFYVWTTTGDDFPGWEGGRQTDGPMEASPTIGNIAGDSDPEIVVMSRSGTLYAWHIDGSDVEGFPMQPVDHYNNKGSFGIGTSPLLADIDNDGKMEIVLNIGWSTTMVDGDGVNLTSNHFPTDKAPIYYSAQLLVNTPAIGDLDNDGDLEMVTFNDNVTMWQLENSGSRADWPVFHRDAKRQGSLPAVRKPRPTFGVAEINLVHDPRNSDKIVRQRFKIDVENVLGYDLTVGASHPVVKVNVVDLGRSADTSKMVEVSVDTSSLTKGKYDLGTVDIKLSIKPDDTSPLVEVEQSIPIVLELKEMSVVYLPIIRR